jgi:hypothetical protein
MPGITVTAGTAHFSTTYINTTFSGDGSSLVYVLDFEGLIRAELPIAGSLDRLTISVQDNGTYMTGATRVGPAAFELTFSSVPGTNYNLSLTISG